MTDKPDTETDELAIYMTTGLHQHRMEDAMKRTVEKLVNVSRDDLFAGFSEAIGTAFGVGHFYRTLGLKHQAARLFTGIYKWLKSGAD